MTANAPALPLGTRENSLLDDRIRGVPPGTVGLDSTRVASLRWHPAGGRAEVVKLNDQHAFLSVSPDDDIVAGDVLEFGISQPCTCLDRYRVIFGVDESGYVHNLFPTHFG